MLAFPIPLSLTSPVILNIFISKLNVNKINNNPIINKKSKTNNIG
jgi:hypothetical protein